MQPGEIYIIIDNPVSKTVDGYEGRAVEVLEQAWFTEVLVQIIGEGPIGRRRVLIEDLVPGGQLEMKL